MVLIWKCLLRNGTEAVPYRGKKWGDRGCDRPTACYAKQVCSVELQKD